MVEKCTPIPKTIFANKQIIAAWECINLVHNMYFDASDSKKGFLLYGESGLGKTFLLKQYAKQVKVVYTGETHTMPILYLALNRSAKSIDEIPLLLINALGAPLPIKKPSPISLEKQLVHMLKEKHVELIMLDEIQNLNTSYDGLEFQRVIKYFCALIDREDIQCSFIFAGSEYAKRIMSFGQTDKRLHDGEHLSRRLLRPLQLKPIKPRSNGWISCVNWFMKTTALPPIKLENHTEFMDRLYLAYSERAMSSMKDLFIKPNSQKARTLNELETCLCHNFQIYGKSELNPFCHADLTADKANELTRQIFDRMTNSLVLQRTKAFAQFG